MAMFEFIVGLIFGWFIATLAYGSYLLTKIWRIIKDGDNGDM